MNEPPDPGPVDDLREHWRDFARSDALGAAVVGAGRRDRDAFYQSGAQDVSGILDFVGEVGRGRVLDLGCGPGRLLPALATEFERVDGVDIAQEMLDAAQRAPLPANAHLSLSSGSDLGAFGDGSFDLVVALLVLQHIPDDRLLLALLTDVARVLSDDGRAFLQFDSRPSSIVAGAVQRLPDRLLPHRFRRYMRRTRRTPRAIDSMLAEVKLRVTNEHGRGTGSHHLAVSRLAPPAS